jgi:hypothetical protein
MLGRGAFYEDARTPCENKTENIAEVVSGIRHERQRMRMNTESDLRDYVGDIQNDSDQKNPTEIRRVPAIV